MLKVGAPMDRMFLLRSDHEFNSEHALSIEQGHLKVSTGPLLGNTNVIPQSATTDTTVEFVFDGLQSLDALEVRGAISSLGIQPDSVLVSGDIAPSLMKWQKGDVTGRPPMLPYTAYHDNLQLHPSIVNHFGIVSVLGGETGWPKMAPSNVDFASGNTGASFISQQQLGLLSVFCNIR